MDEKPSFFQSKTFKGILYGLGIAVVLLLAFEAGVSVGYQKAMFSSRWAQNYSSSIFPRPEMPFPPGKEGMDFLPPEKAHGFLNAHGAFGEILKLNQSDFVVKGKDEAEKTVNVMDSTMIERNFDKIPFTDLKVGEDVIVFGSPNDAGQIEAKLVRVLPENISIPH